MALHVLAVGYGVGPRLRQRLFVSPRKSHQQVGSTRPPPSATAPNHDHHRRGDNTSGGGSSSSSSSSTLRASSPMSPFAPLHGVAAAVSGASNSCHPPTARAASPTSGNTRESVKAAAAVLHHVQRSQATGTVERDVYMNEHGLPQAQMPMMHQRRALYHHGGGGHFEDDIDMDARHDTSHSGKIVAPLFPVYFCPSPFAEYPSHNAAEVSASFTVLIEDVS